VDLPTGRGAHPSTAIAALAEQFARQNPTWGYQRIQGELLKVALTVGAATIRRILRSLRIPPTPSRADRTTWRTFLRAQATTMLARDYSPVDCAVTLQRIDVFFVIEIHTRHVHILETTTHPDRPWATQQARNLAADLEDRTDNLRFLIRDRAGQFTTSFDTVLADAGIQTVTIPPRCPQANAYAYAYAKRFVRTVSAEPTDRLLIFGQRHLRRVLAEPVAHYNHQRPHRGRDLQPPSPIQPAPTDPTSPVDHHTFLGGLINEYRNAA
jgi:putative transposase